jgi:plasmid replication initiation protein
MGQTTAKILLSRYRLTGVECRLVFHLIKQIETDGGGFAEYRYAAKKLLRIAGLQERDKSGLLPMMTELFQKTVHIGKPAGWIQYHWFDTVEWNDTDDVLIVSFNDGFKPYLLHLRKKYTLRDFRKMNSCGVFPWTGEDGAAA